MLTEAELQREAAATGYQVDVLEKVLRLVELLDSLRRHPFLKSRLVLKGGTALNLFVFEVPRLSVDLDLNYVGSVDREIMLAERPKVEQAIEAVCGRLGIGVKRVPTDHAGGKWRLAYTTVSGRPGTLELDVNFMLRSPLWPPRWIDSRAVGSFHAHHIPVLDIHELAAGKLAALFARSASRDVFDARELLRRPEIDAERLRIGFVVYGGINRRDWREVSVDDVSADAVEVGDHLIPMLRRELAPRTEELEHWASDLMATCREALHKVLPLRPNEVGFLEDLNQYGRIVPEWLTDDPKLRERIARHPALAWKALNVRENHDGGP